MKRLVLLALLAVALPAPHAVACTPAPPSFLTVSRDRVAPGATLQVSGEAIRNADGSSQYACPTGRPSLSPAPTPTQTASPLVSLPPVPPIVPLPASDPTQSVRLRIVRIVDPVPHAPGRALTVAPVTQAPYDEEGRLRFAFETTVTIPRDLGPGRYVLHADHSGSLHFGHAEIEVVGNLASSGTDLSRLALLAMLAGGTVLALSRRAAGS